MARRREVKSLWLLGLQAVERASRNRVAVVVREGGELFLDHRTTLVVLPPERRDCPG